MLHAADIATDVVVHSASIVKRHFCSWCRISRRCFYVTVSLFFVLITVRLNFSKYALYESVEIKMNPKDSTRRPLCSFPVLRASADKITGYLPANGNWSISKSGSVVQFQPKICQFKYGRKWPTDVVRSCLAANGFKSIVMIGDSNGVKYYWALRSFLMRKDYSCKVVEREMRTNNSRDIDASFYATDKTNLSEIRVHRRACSGCFSRKQRCNETKVGGSVGGSDAYVNATFLSMEYSNDTEVTSLHSMTSQEFIFKEYLKGAGNVPDLLILFDNSHDHQRSSFKDYEKAVEKILDLIDLHLPSSTRVLWLSKPSFYAPLQDARWRDKRFEKNYDINKWLDRSNLILFKQIKERFLRKRRSLIFFDTLNLVDPVQSLLSVDGVHLKAEWYDHVVSYIFQTFCADLFK